MPIPSNGVSSRRTVRPGVVSGRPRVSAGPAPAHRADLAQSRLFAALLLLSLTGVVIFALTSAISHLLLRRWHESAIRREN